MLNREERRAIANGKPFRATRYIYQPYHVFVGVDADIEDAWIEFSLPYFSVWSEDSELDITLWLDALIVPIAPEFE